jgi:hypothetical protein
MANKLLLIKRSNVVRQMRNVVNGAGKNNVGLNATTDEQTLAGWLITRDDPPINGP